MNRLGVYIHVPFCSTRCRYCDFYRIGDEPSRREHFFRALLSEIQSRAEWRGGFVSSVYLGGGTPSRAEPEQIERTLAALRAAVAIAPDAEVTLEANPSDVEESKAVAWRQAGVNRVSLGIQSFVDRELRLLGRRHGPGGALEAVRTLRRIGFDNLSLDLMLGIPAQTTASFRKSLEGVLALGPEHVSAYLLEVHQGTEFDGLRRERPGLFAGEDALERRYWLLHEALSEAGYEHYEISNFSLPGRRSRHNLLYWTGGDWIGLGPAAHSAIGSRRFRHPPDLKTYLVDPVGVEELPCDRLEERVVLGLRLAEGVSRATLEAAGFGARGVESWAGSRREWVRWDGRSLRLKPEGWLVSNVLLAELLELRAQPGPGASPELRGATSERGST